MRKPFIAMMTVSSAVIFVAVGQEATRFDRPVLTMDGAVLCPRQEQISAVRRALENNDRPAADRMVAASCKVVGPDIRLSVVSAPGLRDPDVEVRVASAPGLDPSLPRGPRWTLKTMVRN
ncbi:hypothetical protein ACFQY5_37025 [Paeniroseomonas aquatica]|uniref:Uncharacterized protein n=1 Tax=Paeniroseomonas aquatica TaxID=373043 RepID=A0ABT7ZZQ5_9PROT|nr:hypothetical protein [Paeniroseomonas aquatica]MDN3562955.1 hypothetical protein [Paeniroseomonas aquatica]